MPEPTSNDPIVIVSADGHAAPPLEHYRAYLPAAYHEQLDEFIATEGHTYDTMLARSAFPPAEERAVYDHDDTLGTGGESGSYDWERRRVEMDAEGCVCEIVHSGTQASPALWFGIVNRPRSPELRMIGAQAWHRWLADMMSQSGGRMFGVGEPGPCLDMNASVAELHWLADHGFVSVGLPGISSDPALPPLHDPHFEPFWDACEERGLVLSMHAGWGQPQGVFYDFFDRFAAMAGEGENPMDAFAKLREQAKDSDTSPLRLDIGPRRAMWQLMIGGVFDRHPGLKLAITEVRADWVPTTLAFLDDAVRSEKVALPRSPSQCFADQCAVTPSSIHRCEVEMRHDIGLRQLMFGADYPHHEGTWPNSREWIQVAFAGVPEAEARLILGGNAIDFYGLDRAPLVDLASRIGPRAVDVLIAEPMVPAPVVDHFHKRAGFARPADHVDVTELGDAFRDDVRALAGAR